MPSLRSVIAASSALALCVAVMTGCGSSSQKGLLTSAQANSINSVLSSIDDALAATDCQTVASEGMRLRAVVNGLPGTVDAGLKSNLLEGADTVAARSVTDCAKTASTTDSSSSSSSSSSSTDSSTSSSSSSSSSSSTSSSTTSSTTTPTTPTTTPTTQSGGGAGVE